MGAVIGVYTKVKEAIGSNQLQPGAPCPPAMPRQAFGLLV